MGKSFVSFSMPEPPPPVKQMYGRIAVTKQFMDEHAIRLEAALDNALGDLARTELERRRNQHIGPMHRPTRMDYNDIWRAEFRRRINRSNIAALGKPAGEFRRPS